MRRIAGLAMHVYEDRGIGRFFNISRSLFLKTRKLKHKIESALFYYVAEVWNPSKSGQHIRETSP